jgi:hypothetical protein
MRDKEVGCFIAAIYVGAGAVLVWVMFIVIGMIS